MPVWMRRIARSPGAAGSRPLDAGPHKPPSPSIPGAGEASVLDGRLCFPG